MVYLCCVLLTELRTIPLFPAFAIPSSRDRTYRRGRLSRLLLDGIDRFSVAVQALLFLISTDFSTAPGAHYSARASLKSRGESPARPSRSFSEPDSLASIARALIIFISTDS